MPITPYRVSTDLFRPVFDELFWPFGDGNRVRGLMRAPAADVVETENEIRVVAEMPGIDAKDISVDVENNVLTIEGEKREERHEGDDRDTWHLSERRYGRFSRSFVLPREVDHEGIQASFHNGVLTVTVPKSERARKRRIAVESAGQPQPVESSEG